jgi:D-lactate dehydrogenase
MCTHITRTELIRKTSFLLTYLVHKYMQFSVKNFSAVMGAVPSFLNFVNLTHRIVGSPIMNVVSSGFGPLLGVYWNKYIPRGASKIKAPAAAAATAPKVVYFATCVSRSMGPALGDIESASIHEKTLSLLEKAGMQVVYPSNLSDLCCGLIYDSRGLPVQVCASI